MTYHSASACQTRQNVISEHNNYLTMLYRQIIHIGQSRIAARWFTRSSITRESNKAKNNPVEDVLGKRMYRVTNFDRFLLAWVKRYPSKAEVPDKITVDCLLNARSKARIKCTNYLIVVSIIGFLCAAISGKRAVAKGESLKTMRDQWYQEMLDKDKKK